MNVDEERSIDDRVTTSRQLQQSSIALVQSSHVIKLPLSRKKQTWVPACGINFSTGLEAHRDGSSNRSTHFKQDSSTTYDLQDGIRVLSIEDSSEIKPASQLDCSSTSRKSPNDERNIISNFTGQETEISRAAKNFSSCLDESKPPGRDTSHTTVITGDHLGQGRSIDFIEGNFVSSPAHDIRHIKDQHKRAVSFIINAAPNNRPNSSFENCGIEFVSPDRYKISKFTLNKAKNACVGSLPAYWTYKMYVNEQGERPKCSVCPSKDIAEIVAHSFLDKPVVGFDMEWNIAKRQGRKISLIQLATEDSIALFHLAKFEGFHTTGDVLPPTLKQILEDPKTIKTGVHIKADSTVLMTSTGIRMQGIFELSHLYNLLESSYRDRESTREYSKKAVALATQVQRYLELPLKKGSICVSDWSATLTEEQTEYAACDAYAGLQLYYAMEQKRKLLKPCPPCPGPADLQL